MTSLYYSSKYYIIYLRKSRSDDPTQTVEEVLAKLGATNQPRIDVLNKCDVAPEDDFPPLPHAVRISAKTGEGLEALSQAIAQNLRSREQKIVAMVPFDKYAMISEMRSMGRVLEEEYTDEGTRVTAMLDAAAYGKLLARYPGVLEGKQA